jgi:hypothetical protein
MVAQMSLQLGDGVENHTTGGEAALELDVLKGRPRRTHSFLQWFSETKLISLVPVISWWSYYLFFFVKNLNL